MSKDLNTIADGTVYIGDVRFEEGRDLAVEGRAATEWEVRENGEFRGFIYPPRRITLRELARYAQEKIEFDVPLLDQFEEDPEEIIRDNRDRAAMDINAEAR